MPRIQLPNPQPFPMSLSDAMASRHSMTRGRPNRPFTEQELGTMLGHALSVKKPDGTSRKYPSGGGTYPIETYLVGSILADYPPGVFHYQPKAHALEHLWDMLTDVGMEDIIKTKDAPLSGALLLFTACWKRSGMKYGDFAYTLGTLEAGHMAQNILLAATALGIGSRPIAGIEDDVVTRLLDLDLETEQPLYSIVLATPLFSEGLVSMHSAV